MDSAALAGPLLRDAMERVVANPTASPLWHVLLARHEACGDAEARRDVCDGVAAQVAPHGIGGFLAATFLAWVTGDDAHTAQAGRIVLGIEPVDPERLMAFATFEWGRALPRQGDRAGFVRHLLAARLPEAMDLAGRHLPRHCPVRLPARAVTGLRKVALVAPFIGPAAHAPSGLALRQAAVLRDLGVEVRVFAAQELLLPDMPHYLGSMGRAAAPEIDTEALVRLLPDGVTVTLADARFSLPRRWGDLLAAIAGFDPDLVLFVGLFSPLLTPLFAARPVLGLCIHAVAPMAPVDAWLTASTACGGRSDAAWGPVWPAAWGHYHPYRVARPSAGAALSRAALGVPEHALLLVSVGARLEAEIGGTWAARMAALLARRPGLVWLLVGGAGVRPAALDGVADAQLRALAHRDDLPAVLDCCDLFVNPPRVGGGFSVAEAMAAGLPVLALADSDGGAKLGPHAMPDEDRYFARLEALIADPALREGSGAAMRALFAATLDLARSGGSLREACARTIALFDERRSGAPRIVG